MGCGPGLPPERGKDGETKFGFTISQRVRIKCSDFFSGWVGHVLAFSDWWQ